jgi:ribosomal protein S18 acetylase RimI-like enzyme
MTNAGMSVRSARTADCKQFVELLKSTDLFVPEVDNEGAFQRKLAHDPESILVVEHQGNVVGMAMLIYDPWASTIWHFAVAAEYQRMGCGTALLHEAERRLRSRGTQLSFGYVLEGNMKSRNFFRREGYVESFTNGDLVAIDKVL